MCSSQQRPGPHPHYDCNNAPRLSGMQLVDGALRGSGVQGAAQGWRLLHAGRLGHAGADWQQRMHIRPMQRLLQQHGSVAK
jgi:hypothetical protein